MKLTSKLLFSAAVLGTLALAAQAQVPGVNSTLNAVFTLAYDNGTMKPTFSSTSIVVPASSATDVCSLRGSATKDVRVRRVLVSGLASVVQSEVIGVVKRSTANTGDGLQPPVVPYDTTNSLTRAANAGTAVAETHTVNPTLGTLVGALADRVITWGNLSTGVGSGVEFNFGAQGSPVVLRGIAQQIAVNLNTNTLVTGQVACTFEWTEE